VESDYLLRHAYLSVCLSVYTHGTTWIQLDGFSRNSNLSTFRKCVEKIQDTFKSEKNKGYFTWAHSWSYLARFS